jgi:hypothetical protein
MDGEILTDSTTMVTTDGTITIGLTIKVITKDITMELGLLMETIMEAEDITTDKEEVEEQDLQYHLHMVIEEDPLQELVQDKFLQTQEYTLVHNLRELL